MVEISLKLSFLSNKTEGMVLREAIAKEKQREVKIQNSLGP